MAFPFTTHCQTTLSRYKEKKKNPGYVLKEKVVNQQNGSAGKSTRQQAR